MVDRKAQVPGLFAYIENEWNWRCCPGDTVPALPEDHCKPNNLAYDNILLTIRLVQNRSGNTFARIFAPNDTYYVHVYIRNKNLDTEWQVHTHEVKYGNWSAKWGPIDTHGLYQMREREAKIQCHNVLNGKKKCGKTLTAQQQQLPATPETEFEIYEIFLKVTIVRDLTTRDPPEGVYELVPRWQDLENLGAAGYVGLVDFGDCPDIREFISHQHNSGQSVPMHLDRKLSWCLNGHSIIYQGMGCTPPNQIPVQFGCGPLNEEGKWIPQPEYGFRRIMENDWSAPKYTGIYSNKIGSNEGVGPPDSVMNSVVAAPLDPLVAWKDAVKEGDDAGKDLNWWNGIHYPWGFMNGILIGGEFYPKGELGDPEGCSECDGPNPPAWGPPLPLPTGTGCGTCTYIWDSGVTAWTHYSTSAACSGILCDCPMPPWPGLAPEDDGTTRSTGCNQNND